MVAVAFVHPDLGIGGAERFVVDAAVALKNCGHKVQIFTSHHDESHCFIETRDGTLQVTAVGDWLPRHLFGRLHALFAYIRMIYVAFYLTFISDFNADIVFCDQVAACIPVLKLKKESKVLFYCHFPDLLLTQRKNIIKKLYRKPLDWIEEKTTGMASLVMVNSKFTAQAFRETFKSLNNYPVSVMYPSINMKGFDIDADRSLLRDMVPPTAVTVFLSINRYERKKNLVLALESLTEFRKKVKEETWKQTHLIMAGGYDERVAENKQHYLELRHYAEEKNLASHVTFIRSFSDTERVALLKYSSCLLYTPSGEHFGLVPIEAMYMKCPVIACNSGGPLETVINDATGFLCDANPLAFSTAMKKIAEKKDLKKTFGNAGNQHVVENFSFKAFTEKLDKSVKTLVFASKGNSEMKKPNSKVLIVCLCIAFAAILVYCISMTILIYTT
eukprot:gene7929-8784_t